MLNHRYSLRPVLWILPSIALLAGAARAQDNALRIDVSNSSGAASLDLVITQFARDAVQHTYDWVLDAPVQLRDPSNGQTVATIQSLELTIRQWSQFDLTMLATAGSDVTTFRISSESLSFPTLPASVATARSRARFTIVDLNNDGATLRGLGAPGTGAFQSWFTDGQGQSNLYSQLVGLIACGAGGSGYAEQRDPISGYRAVGDSVSDISFFSGFTLTAGDQVSAFMSYDMNPDPPNCVADFNNDGQVGMFDVMRMLSSFGMTGVPHDLGDTNGDGIVDLTDLMRVMNEFGERCP